MKKLGLLALLLSVSLVSVGCEPKKDAKKPGEKAAEKAPADKAPEAPVTPPADAPAAPAAPADAPK
jgi:hypothetical protein